MSADGAIVYLQGQMATLSGIRAAPARATEQPHVFPFSLCQYASSEFVTMSGWVESRHTIWLDIHVARRDLVRDLALLLPFVESVRHLLLNDPTLGGNVDTIQSEDNEPLTARSIVAEWDGGVKTIALRFTIVAKTTGAI